MDMSKFLSRVLGIYFVIISIAMLLNMSQFIDLVSRLIHDTPLMVVTGFFVLILGILMIVGHNIWRRDYRVIITLISWLIFLKGVSIIFYPELIDQVTTVFAHNLTIAYTAAGVDLVLGLLLCYFGFRR